LLFQGYEVGDGHGLVLPSIRPKRYPKVLPTQVVGTGNGGIRPFLGVRLTDRVSVSSRNEHRRSSAARMGEAG
jgi:hypothetical protein